MERNDRRTPLNQIRDLLRATELTDSEAEYLRGLIDARVRGPRYSGGEYDSKFGEVQSSGRD